MYQKRPGKRHLRGINGGRGRRGLGSSETDALAMQAGMAYLTGGASTAAGASSTAGAAPGSGTAPGGGFQPTTTVSPNIQTTISPQISPIFQQSSGGGDLTAGGASQYSGGQSGQGGGSSPQYGGAPVGGGSVPQAAYGVPSPLVGAGGDYTSAYPTIPAGGFIAQQSGLPSWMWIAGGLVIAGLLYFAYQKSA